MAVSVAVVRPLVIGVASLIVACYQASPATGAPCAADGSCPVGQVCDRTPNPPICLGTLPADSALRDGTLVDAARLDASIDALPPLPDLVQQAVAGAGTGSPLTATLPAPPAAGSVLIVLVGSRQAPLSGVSGGGVGTWQRAVRSVINCNAEIWYGVSDGSSAAVSVLLPGNTGSIFVNVSEWRGLAAPATLDGVHASSALASPATAGSITTVHAHDLIVFAASEVVPVSWGVPGPGSWTALTHADGGACEQAAWYRFVTATGTFAPTVSETGAENWDAAIAAFTVAM